MPKLNFKKIGIGTAIAFFALQLISLVISSALPSNNFFAGLVKGYSLVWIFIILALVIVTLGYFVFNIRELNKGAIFVFLLVFSIIAVIVVYGNIDLGRAFDMSIARTQLDSTLGSVVPATVQIPTGSILGDTFTNVWLGFGTFGQGAILLVGLITLITFVITKK